MLFNQFSNWTDVSSAQHLSLVRSANYNFISYLHFPVFWSFICLRFIQNMKNSVLFKWLIKRLKTERLHILFSLLRNSSKFVHIFYVYVFHLPQFTRENFRLLYRPWVFMVIVWRNNSRKMLRDIMFAPWYNVYQTIIGFNEAWMTYSLADCRRADFGNVPIASMMYI